MLGPRPVVEDQLALAMEPVGRPIGRHVAAVPPDRADLHPTQRLPHGLAAADTPLRSDHLAVARHDALWDGRHFLIDAAAYPAQDSEAKGQNDRQHDPESLHARSLLVSRHPGLSAFHTGPSVPTPARTSSRQPCMPTTAFILAPSCLAQTTRPVRRSCLERTGECPAAARIDR